MTVNAAQAGYWTDVAGPHWVAQQQLFDQMLTHFGAEALRVFAAAPGERVADIGCGTGASSLVLADAVGDDGRVVGLDISSTMVDAARLRAVNRPQLSFVVADAQIDQLTTPAQPFDGVFSRFGVMFFDDPVAAFANIGNAVRSGGRLTFACWQDEEHNEWISRPAAVMREFTPEPVFPPAGAPGPFAFRDRARIVDILTTSDWVDVDVQPFSAPTVMGGGQGVDAAVAQTMGTTVGQILRKQVDDATFAKVTDAVRSMMAEHLVEGAVTFTGNVWIVSARRR